jgi:PBSX family phage terminase large subunit
MQDLVLHIPECVDLFLGGGRGGGKDYTIAHLILRHVEQYGARARVLYVRKSYKGLADFELVTREIFGIVYGTDAKYNGSEHVWRFPNGAFFELGQLETHADYQKYQGRSFTLLVVSEAGQYADPQLLDLMRSNIRGPRDMPLRMIMAANPGGPGHYWLAQRYVLKAKPWTLFTEPKSKREWINCPSTFLDNPFIDQQQYRDQLESSCPDDPELLRAWIEGDWTVARGAYFAECIDAHRNAVGKFTSLPETFHRKWETWLAHDYGSAAPSVTYLMSQSLGGEFEGKYYPRDSIVILDEYATYRRHNLNQGLGYNAATTAERIIEFCDRWKVKPMGVADDAIFSNQGNAATIAQEFSRKGVNFHPARKGDRISGWQKMKRLLADAGKPDVPGLYVSLSCEYFWATVPYLARDTKHVEDLDSSGADHGADACRYGLLRPSFNATVEALRL